MINSKPRSYTFRMALVVGATFLLVTLVLGVLGQWASAVTLAVATIFFSLLALTGHQLNRALLEKSALPLTFPGSPPLPLYHPIDLSGSNEQRKNSSRSSSKMKRYQKCRSDNVSLPEWNIVDEGGMKVARSSSRKRATFMPWRKKW
jgi:hypothetical protein